MVNLKEWMDKHEVTLDELGTDRVLEACYEALYDILRQDYYYKYVSDNRSEIASELLSELPELSPTDFLELVNRFIEKKQEDWRILISDDFDGESGYENFYLEHETEFAEWLKKQGEEFKDDMNYYLNEGVDELLEFAYEYLGGKDAIDVVSGIRNIAVLDKIDVNGFIEANEDELLDILEEMIDDYLKDTDWFTEWIMDGSEYDRAFHDGITPDDYYPVWNYAWEFPASYDPAELNKEMNGIGLIFFELNGMLYVTLATAGMSMMPALYYAYAIYSNLNVDPKEIAQDIVSHGVEYYKYVIKEERLAELAEYIGYSIEGLNEISKRDYEEFSNLLNKLRNEVDEGKLSRLEAAIISMAAIAHKPDVDGAKIH